MKKSGIVIDSEKSKIIEPVLQKNRDLRDTYRKIFYKVTALIDKIIPSKKTKVLEKDWDHLIVLDACRYDYFKTYNPFKRGRLKKILSAGTHTSEWLVNNFNNTSLDDIVYISSNPQISDVMINKKLGEVPFYKLDNVWDYGWDEEYEAVLPKTTTDAALRSIKKHPDKRHIIHYLQPHLPFLKDENLRKDGISPIGDRSKEKRSKIWKDLREGRADPKRLKRAYKNNLLAVLPEVKRLVENLEGKIVITADHGNLLGEYFLFAHPSHCYLPELLEVPWLELDR